MENGFTTNQFRQSDKRIAQIPTQKSILMTGIEKYIPISFIQREV